MRNVCRTTTGRACFSAWVVLALCALPWAVAQAQPAPQAVAVQAVAATKDEKPAAPRSSTMLDTNSDLDTLLERAAAYLGSGQYREGLTLCQHVVDKYADTLTTSDDRHYQPARLYVERMMARLGDEGLATYRLTADGQAKALLNGESITATRNAKALKQIADRYFISTIGDDAAYLLGCMLLDQHDDHGARRMFRKVLNDHPDPSVNRDQLLLRLALVNMRLGDQGRAEAILKDLADRGNTASRQLALLRTYVAASNHSVSASPQTDWPIRFGNPSRTAQLPDTHDTAAQDGDDHLWAQAWVYKHPLLASSLQWGGHREYYSGGRSRLQMVQRWREHHWLPTTQMRYAQDRLLFKTHAHLVCMDRNSGEVLWQRQEGEDEPVRQFAHSVTSYRSSSSDDSAYPSTLEERMLFGDEVRKCISIVDHTVFMIEHHRPNAGRSRNEHQMVRRHMMNHNGAEAVGTQLSAIDLDTGKLKWRLGRQPGSNTPLNGATFLATPIKADGHLLLPVLENDEVRLVALDPKSGKLRWKTFLCAPRETELQPWTPTVIACADGEAYVASGHGVVFAVDLHGGAMRWAARYKRDLKKPEKNHHHWGAKPAATPLGWDQNAVFVVGGWVVVLPTDSKHIMAFDRVTGRQHYRLLVSAPRYALGVVEGGLIVATNDALYSYNAHNAKLQWQAPLDVSPGRAALSRSVIYVPQGNRIVQLDARGGRRLAETRAVTSRDDPLGNLLCDGRRIYAAGMEYVYAVMDTQHLLADITRKIKIQPNIAAYHARARTHRQVGQTDQAIHDLRLAINAPGKEEARDAARGELLDELINTLATSEQPQQVLEEADQIAKTNTQKLRVDLARADHAARSGAPIEAARTYLNLLAEEGQTTISLSPNSQASVRAIAGARLADLMQTHQAVISPLVHLNAQQAWDQAFAHGVDDTNRYHRLMAIARQFRGSIQSRHAMIQIAQLAAKVGQFESAEAVLSRWARSSDAREAATARWALGNLYADRGWRHMARLTFQAAIADHADIQIDHTEPAYTVGELAGEKLSQLAGNTITDTVTDLSFGGPPWRRTWFERGYGSRTIDLIQHEADPSTFLRNHVLVFIRHGRSRLVCRRADTGRIAWQLPLMQYAARDMQIDQYGRLHAGGRWEHMLVLPAGKGLAAYSLLTGKRIWQSDRVSEDDAKTSTAHPAQNQHAQLLQSRSDHRTKAGLSTVSVGDGLVVQQIVAKDMTEMVQVHDAATGQVIWRRFFNDEAIDGVRIACGVVNVITGGGTELASYDRATGQLLCRAKLPDLDSDSPVIWTERGVVCRNQRDRETKLIQLPAGKVAWTVRSRSWVRLRQLNDQTGCLYSSDGVKIFNLDTGHVIASLDSGVVGRNLQDVAMTRDGLELYTLGWGNRGGQTLRIVQIKSGKQLTSIDFGNSYGQRISAQTLADAGEFIPWVERIERKDGSHNANRAIAIYRKRTGKRYTKHALPTPLGNGHLRYTHEAPQVINGVLIVNSNEGQMGFVHDDNPLPAGGVVHTVQPGETLASITRKYYGDEKHLTRITKANPDEKIGPLNKITAGTKLKIPGRKEEPEESSTSGTITVQDKDGVRYLITDQDTPFSEIAREIQKAHRDGVKVQVKMRGQE